LSRCRYRIRGISNLIFYSVPERMDQFSWMANLLEEATTVTDGSRKVGGAATAASCILLYTRYEALALQRIVGEQKARAMLQSAKNTFMFV